MTNFIGRLGVTLGLDSAEFSRGIDGASKKLEQLAASAKRYGSLAGTALVAASTAAIAYADELVDVANANDVAISSIIQLRDALAKSGGEAGNASKFLSSFTQYIDKAADGSFEAQKTLKGLGISLQDLKTLSIDELFRKAAIGLSQMDDSLTRSAKGMEVFGKSFKGVDARGFAEELSKATTVSKKHEEGIKAAAEAYDMLAEKSRRAMEGLAATVGPAIKSAIENFDKLIAAMKVSGEEIDKVAKKYELAFSRGGFKRPEQEKEPVLPGLSAEQQDAMFADRAKPASRVVKAGVNKDAEAERKRLLDNWAKGYLALQAEIEDGNKAIAEQSAEFQRKELEFLEKRKVERQNALRQEQDEIEEGNRLIAEQSSEFQKANAALANRQSAEAESINRQKIMLDLADKGLLMKAREYQFAQEILAIQFRYADAVKEIKANESLSATDKEAALLRLKALTESEFDVAKQRLKLAEKMQNATFGEGFFVAMIQSARNATTAFQYGQQAFESMMGNMGAALNQFVQTGKLSFKDLAKSIIQDLIAIQLRAQATALFSRMIGGMYSGGATVGPGMAAEALPAGFNQYLAARAEGGPVSGNSPYLVGERGPELFVPNRSGTIVPTNQLAGAMGGGQTVNYNGPFIQQMSAIDTQSAIQFLAQNKQAVWAANQSAQRSLPMSR
jgi:lambda family phage tail tape measure protein